MAAAPSASHCGSVNRIAIGVRRPSRTDFGAGALGFRRLVMWRVERTAQSGRSAVSAQDVSDSAEDRSFLTALAARLRCGRPQPPGETRERKRLHPHATRSAQRGEEEALAAEDHGLHT